MGEFFWGEDPGNGLGETLLAIDGNFNSAIEQMISNNTQMPSPGIHQFNIRLKDRNGVWRPVYSKAIKVQPSNTLEDFNIQLAEYYWGEDPGEGLGQTMLALDGDFNRAI